MNALRIVSYSMPTQRAGPSRVNRLSMVYNGNAGSNERITVWLHPIVWKTPRHQIEHQRGSQINSEISSLV